MCLQQDITRGRDMVDSLYQGPTGGGGTHNPMLSSLDYLSQAARDLNNIEDGFYISPSFLDKISIHIAKNFLDLPKIKVPLILGEHSLAFTRKGQLSMLQLSWQVGRCSRHPWATVAWMLGVPKMLGVLDSN